MARAQFRQNSTASDGLSLLAVALSSLLWIVPSLAASTHGHQTHATHPKSVFALEHQVGKPGAQFAATMTLSCGPNAVKGNLLISVTEKVINDADSGQAGNYWGLDAFTRTIKVWNLGSDNYCAVVSYNGTFAAQAGLLNTSILAALASRSAKIRGAGLMLGRMLLPLLMLALLTVSGIMPPPATPAISSTWINSEEAVAIGLLREERSCKFAASLFLICSENIKGYNLSLNDPLSTSL